MNRKITTDTLSLILSQSRNQADCSQKFMAQSLGKSLGTIKNWESGIGSPNLIDFLCWFDTLGINPLRYMLNFIYPDKYMDLSENSTDEELKNALMSYIMNEASALELRQLAFCIFGNHTSGWHSQLNMLTAHNHTSLKSRINVAQCISNNYEIEHSRHESVEDGIIEPNIEELKFVIEKAKESVLNNKSGYNHYS